MTLRTCKICGVVGDYDRGALGTKAKGFHGLVCFKCYMEDQRAWRGTELGRAMANAASRESRKHNKPTVPRDAQNALKEATLRLIHRLI